MRGSVGELGAGSWAAIADRRFWLAQKLVTLSRPRRRHEEPAAETVPTCRRVEEGVGLIATRVKSRALGAHDGASRRLGSNTLVASPWSSARRRHAAGAGVRIGKFSVGSRVS